MSLDVYLTMKNKQPKYESDEVFSASITHYLKTMAGKAGVYTCLWYPEELKITKANQLIEFLEAGIVALKSNPDYYKQFNPKNGWGTYEGLIKFVQEYLNACIKYPDADVSILR